MAGKLERFLDPFFYVSKHELVSNLIFDITIWRSRIQDEETRQIVTRQSVRWGERRPGPRDMCNMMRLERHEETIFNFLSSHPGNTAEDRLEHWLRTPCDGLPKMETADAEPLPDVAMHVFTRNEQDGFVNDEELISEVVPPQEPTSLALQQIYGNSSRRPRDGADRAADAKSKDASPDGASGTKANDSGANDQDDSDDSGTRRDRFYVMLGDGHATFHADRPPTWQGLELVLMTLQELSDGQLIAKPSFGETHVLRVDDEFVISYEIAIRGHKHHLVHRQEGHEEADAPHHLSAAAALAKSFATRTSAIPVELQSESLEKQKRTAILRQLVATTGHIPASSSAPSVDAAVDSAAKFTLPPAKSSLHRVHFIGSVDRVQGFDHSDVFLQCEFVLPLKGMEIDSEVNRKCGVAFRQEVLSQTARASRYLNPDNIYVTAHHFNLPFELHAIAEVASPGAARMVVSAWSVESTKRQTLLGYGVLTLAPTPGRHATEIEMWHPTLHGRETLRSVFIGGASSLVNAEDAAIPYQRRIDNLHALAEEVDIMSEGASLGVNSRAGLITGSVGSVTVQWMCAVQQRTTTSSAPLRSRYADQ